MTRRHPLLLPPQGRHASSSGEKLGCEPRLRKVGEIYVRVRRRKADIRLEEDNENPRIDRNAIKKKSISQEHTTGKRRWVL